MNLRNLHVPTVRPNARSFVRDICTDGMLRETETRKITSPRILIGNSWFEVVMEPIWDFRMWVVVVVVVVVV